jgi:hypothetical protein
MDAMPVTVPGAGLTVTVVTAIHPVENILYVIVAVPVDTPLTIPVVSPTVAIAVLPLLQVPPPVPSASVVVAPVHTVVMPVIPAGDGYTVIAIAIVQPVGSV